MDEQEGTERTGHPEVDAALSELDGLPGIPVDEHVHRLDAAHARLRALLTSAGAEPGARA